MGSPTSCRHTSIWETRPEELDWYGKRSQHHGVQISPQPEVIPSTDSGTRAVALHHHLFGTPIQALMEKNATEVVQTPELTPGFLPFSSSPSVLLYHNLLRAGINAYNSLISLDLQDAYLHVPLHLSK